MGGGQGEISYSAARAKILQHRAAIAAKAGLLDPLDNLDADEHTHVHRLRNLVEAAVENLEDICLLRRALSP